MAFHIHQPLTLILLIIVLSLFSTPSHSAITCATQKLPSNRTFKNCTDLPTLGATLHFTPNATSNTLSVAYSAAPPNASGYVAWGLNLAGGGMIGTQALIAFPTNTSSVSVLRYNLTAYKSIDQVKAFTFDSYNISAEHTNGVTTIYATVKIPATATNVTHVWQVGPVADGKPSIHAFKPENLQSKAALPTEVEAATVPSSGNATAPAPGSGNKSGVGKRFNFGWVVAALMMGLIVVVF